MSSLNRYIDHAVLKPEMARADVEAAIKLGVEFETRTVCVRPCDLELACELCRDSSTEVCTVLAFPHGVSLSESKAAEAESYAKLGAREVDMVVNYSYIKSGNWNAFEADVTGVYKILSPHGIPLKVILETAALDLKEVAEATRRCAAIGIDFVKTSTGFGPGGATIKAVQAMLDASDGITKVKASGGIRTIEEAQRFIDMGCARLGVGYGTTPVLCGVDATQSAASAY